jgi:hypothetical protein
MSGPNWRFTSGIARCSETFDSADVGGDHGAAGGGDAEAFGAGRGGVATDAGAAIRAGAAVTRGIADVVARAGAAPIRGAGEGLDPLPGVPGTSARLRSQ